MIPALMPSNERERINTLNTLKILDTPPSKRLDRITRLVANFFNVPVALITLIDTNRQWCKSSYGLKIHEIPRNASICSHTILHNSVLVVPDLQKDSRFHELPSVANPPHFVFYAGYQIRSRQGFALGTLCILDSKTHKFDSNDERHLSDFGKIVEQYFHTLEDINIQSPEAANDSCNSMESLFSKVFNRPIADTASATFLSKWVQNNLKHARSLEYADPNRLKNITDNLPALVSCADYSLHYTFLNKTYEDWFGIPLKDMIGMYMPDVIGYNSFKTTLKHINQVINGKRVSFENKLSTQQGTKYVHTTLIPNRDRKKGEFYILSMDITELKLLQDTLVFEASHDILTGLPNRRAFIKSLNHILKRKEAHPWITLFFLDLDDFKILNDNYGHKFGDDVLKTVAEVINDCIHHKDIAARLAGDEFTILLHNQDNLHDAVIAVCHKLLQKLVEIDRINNISVKLSASIGIIIKRNDDKLTPVQLLSKADKAMYKAKVSGKGRFHIEG